MPILLPGYPTVISTNVGAGASIAPGTHRAGDLLLYFAYRDGSNTAPSLPTGYTNVQNGGANTNSSRCAYKIALSSSEATPAFTNATHCIMYVIRNFDNQNPVGSNAPRSSGSGTTVTYPAMSPLKDQDSKSLVIGFAGHRSIDTNLQTAPTNLANRVTFVDATSEVAAHDAYRDDWVSTNVSVAGTSSGWETIMVEVRDPKFQSNSWNNGARATNGNSGKVSVNGGLG